jgi:hypothetical protein
VHQWLRPHVWQIIERHYVLSHPAYYVGFGRASCLRCIFNGSDGWATVRALDGRGFERIANYEREFGVTIHRTRSVVEQADRGTPFAFDEKWRAIAMSYDFNEPIFMNPWILPIGAYGDGCGPS